MIFFVVHLRRFCSAESFSTLGSSVVADLYILSKVACVSIGFVSTFLTPIL